MKRYSIYCTEEQTKKALELGAPIQECPMSISELIPSVKVGNKTYSNPFAEQMIGWLKEQGLLIIVDMPINSWIFDIYNADNSWVKGKSAYDTRKEATLAAIDAALEYLTKKTRDVRKYKESNGGICQK